MGLRVNGARVPPTQKGIVATGVVDLSDAQYLVLPNYNAREDLPEPTLGGSLAAVTGDGANMLLYPLPSDDPWAEWIDMAMVI